MLKSHPAVFSTANYEDRTLVPVKEAAIHLGVAKESIYPLDETKSLATHKIGRLWKIKLPRLVSAPTGRAWEALGESDNTVVVRIVSKCLI